MHKFPVDEFGRSSATPGMVMMTMTNAAQILRDAGHGNG